MNKMKIVVLTLFTVLLASLAGAWAAQAQQFRTGDAVSVSGGEKIDGSLYVAGKTLTVDADVNGDVFCAGQTVTVTGTVHGDVICAAQTLTVKGKVEGDVRLAGQVVTLEANVEKNATVAAQTFVLEESGNVAGDMTIGANDATLKGSVGRDVVAGTENLILAGIVTRNVSSDSTTTKLGAEARIGGNITYTSYNTLGQTEGAVITGTVTRNDPPADKKQSETFTQVLGKLFYWFVALLLVVLALVLLFPRMFQTVTDRAFPMPWWALLAGFGAMLVMPLVLVLLALTFVGLPLMVVVLVLWIGVALLSGPVFSYYVGRLVLPRQQQPLLVMLTGASIVIIASFIPYLSVLVFILTAWLGSGMLVLEIFRRVSSGKLQTPEAKPKKAAKAAN